MLKALGKLDIVEVPYKGIPQTITDTMGGSLQLTFVDMANALAQQKGGKLRGLAVTNGKRSSLAPELPAVAEELAGYEVIAWFALMAPARLPEPIVQRLNETNMKALAKPEVKERFATVGTDIAPMGPVELGKFIQAEVANWARLVKLAGIQPE
jgi:tripartite-type tricarboxylate transporter receptor subunit TctC